MKPAKRLDNFQEYIFVRLNQKIREVEAKTGKKVLNLAPGTPDIPPSEKLLRKFQELVVEPTAHYYPGYKPLPEFTQAIKNWYKNKYSVELADAEIFNVAGAKEGINVLTLALCDAGDEILMPNPGYQGYPGPALMHGVTPVYYDLFPENKFQPDLAKLEKQITPKTRFIWLNYPSNPTGAVADKTILFKLLELARKHQIILAYDHAYAEIVFTGTRSPSILQFPDAIEVAIELGSFSKTFSFAGYRIGYVLGNKEIIKAIEKTKSQLDSGTFSAIQKLAAFALDNFDSDWNKKMVAEYQRRRELLAKYLPKLGLKFTLPPGALYIWAEIPDKYNNSEEFAFKLLEERQIAVTPGIAFGSRGKRFVRVSVCVDLSEISNYFEKL